MFYVACSGAKQGKAGQGRAGQRRVIGFDEGAARNSRMRGEDHLEYRGSIAGAGVYTHGLAMKLYSGLYVGHLGIM